MKKWLLILAVCTITVSCKWYHETFDSPEECAEWYSEQMWEAIQDNDVDEFIEVYNDADAYRKSLGEVDQKKADEASEKWMEKNCDKEKVKEFYNENAEKLKDVL